MKKLLCIVMAMLMVFLLAACQETPPYEPDSAIALLETIDTAMASLQSVEMTRTTEVTYYAMGYQFELEGESYVFSSQDAHYSENTIVRICEEMPYEQTVKTVEAYWNGKIYSGISDGAYNQKLCADMTHEQYDETQGGNLSNGIDIADCTAAAFSREGENWSLQFSGYTKKTVDLVLQSTGMTEDILGASITDMEVTMTADQNFCVQSMQIRFLFAELAEEGISPQFVISAQYSNFNTAAFDAGWLNTEEFTQVDDILVLKKLSSALSEKQNAASGSFTLDLKTTYDIAGKVTASKETDTVSYGRKNGAYYYRISAQMDGQDFQISYQNGEQAVTMDGQTHTANQSESEAKTFIDSLIDSANFKSTAVTGVEIQEEGVYILTCESLDLTEYAQQADTILISGTQELMVTFADGKLVQITGKTTLIGTCSGEPMTITSESTVVFDAA